MPDLGRVVAALIVGHEPDLRITYRMLFNRAGYIAQSSDLPEADRFLKEFTFPLVVLDHTLSRSERKAAIELIRRKNPVARIVALHSSGADSGADLAMDSREGAEQILARIGAMLGSIQRKPGMGVPDDGSRHDASKQQ